MLIQDWESCFHWGCFRSIKAAKDDNKSQILRMSLFCLLTLFQQHCLWSFWSSLYLFWYFSCITKTSLSWKPFTWSLWPLQQLDLVITFQIITRTFQFSSCSLLSAQFRFLFLSRSSQKLMTSWQRCNLRRMEVLFSITI